VRRNCRLVLTNTCAFAFGSVVARTCRRAGVRLVTTNDVEE
jgi:hypothetical protein